mgnify:CR=1 FL=1
MPDRCVRSESVAEELTRLVCCIVSGALGVSESGRSAFVELPRDLADVLL